MKPDGTPKSRRRTWLLLIVVFIIFDGALLLGLFTRFIVGTVWNLGAGWIFAAERLVRSSNVSPASLLIFFALAAVSIGGAHFLVRWISKSRIRFRSTLCAAGLFWLAIFSGMAIGATVHQLGWLFGSKASWFESSSRRDPDIAYFAVQFMMSSLTSGHPSMEAWREFEKAGYEPQRSKFMIVPFADSAGQIQAVAVRIRDGEKFKRVGGLVYVSKHKSAHELEEEFLSADEFDRWMETRATP